jgi:hypothetical protein
VAGNVGRETDDAHMKAFSHPAHLEPLPQTKCKNGDDCWAIQYIRKEDEENADHTNPHAFFFHGGLFGPDRKPLSVVVDGVRISVADLRKQVQEH